MFKHITVMSAAFLAATSAFAQSAENQAITDSKPPGAGAGQDGGEQARPRGTPN